MPPAASHKASSTSGRAHEPPSDNLLQPDAYTVSDEQSRGALRCIDRNVRDLPDRIEVAQALGLLPYVAHSRRADRTSGPRVERRPS